jgi:chemotaxis signal transduction protein
MSRVQRRQMIQFDVGGAVLAIPAVDIHATLPRRTIDRNALTGGISLGSIDLTQGQVAVVSASALFGIGTPVACEASEVIVVPMPNGALIGLAVARILRIAEVDLSQAVVMPRGAGEGLLSASLVDAGGTALFLVDPEALRSDRHLRELSAVTRRAPVSTTFDPRSLPHGQAAGEQSIERRRDRYLLLDAGARLAAQIASVTRILPMPRTIIPLAGTDPRVIGLTVIDREVLPLIRPEGMDFPTSEATRVLIVDTDRSRVAVAVRQVLGVITSQWRARTGRSEDAGGADGHAADGPCTGGHLIRAAAGAEGAAPSALYRVIDLSAEADVLALSLPAARRGEPAV